MQLHRTDGQADWTHITPTKYTSWQRLAVRTHGFVTPGNFVTLMGFLIVLTGLLLLLQHEYWWGLGVISVGRAADVLDGWLADRTKTKGPIGEAADVIVDKICTALTLLSFYIAHIAPGWTIILLLLPHLFISGINSVRRAQHETLPHPSLLGKLSMAGTWLCLALFILLSAVHLTSSQWEIAVVTLSCIISGAGLYTTLNYIRRID